MFVPLTAFPEPGRVSADTLVDVFPLVVGNSWTYRYFTFFLSQPSGNPDRSGTDSGIAIYTVVGSAWQVDSTIWTFRATRNLTRHVIFSSLGSQDHDTLYSVSDTTVFELVESNSGQHQLYRIADPYLIHSDIIPFTRNYTDTTRIWRYRAVGVGDSTEIQSWVRPAPSAQFRSVFTFGWKKGLIRRTYNSGTIDGFDSTNHYLLDASITAVESEKTSSAPVTAQLLQNFPNPFNPTTTINYFVPVTAHVILNVFDPLGRKVACLSDGISHYGQHQVVWRVENLASGVYFYQLQTGTSVLTRSMILIK
jgi:hypothetical protein